MFLIDLCFGIARLYTSPTGEQKSPGDLE